MGKENSGSEESQKPPKPPDPGRLQEHELFWRDHYNYLKDKGYQLRPRYRPQGKLSGKSRKEAQLVLHQPKVMDAIRAADGQKVCLKIMNLEEKMQTRGVSTKYRSVPENRAIRIRDLLPIPGSEEDSIAVMPYLREFDDPQFETLGEVIDALDQFLEGLEFFHSKGFAHRDACSRNLMMDASELIPNGWHFARTWAEDGFKPISFVPRSSINMKYYFIDFGLSVTVDDMAEPVASGIVGQDRSVPEFQAKDPKAKYNPFKLDIYQLGNTFQTRLLDRYNGLDSLEPLIKAMTSESPVDRPTASEAREKLVAIAEAVESKSIITLKPGERVWGSNPPGGRPGRLFASLESLKTWLSTRVTAIRKRLF